MLELKSNQNIMNLKLTDFDGPLDLLLTLIRENKLDIMNMDICELVDQYLQFISAQKDLLKIDVAGEYLLMATTLINIKSRKLLNFSDDLMNSEDQFDYEKDLLIKQILEYKKYKDIFPKLVQKYNNRQTLKAKHKDNIETKYGINKNSEFKLPEKIDPEKLYVAMQKAYDNWKINQLTNRNIIVQELKIDEIEDEILLILQKNKKRKEFSLSDFLSLIDQMRLTDQFFVACFVSLLELVKCGHILLFQKNYDDEIYIEVLE